MYRIIKEIHTYSGRINITFIIQDKTFCNKWVHSKKLYKSYFSYEDAENVIIEDFSKDLGGIIEVDNNIYRLIKLSLPTP